MREIVKPSKCYICKREGTIKKKIPQPPIEPGTSFARAAVDTKFYCPRCRNDFTHEYKALEAAENALAEKIETLKAARN